LKEYIQNILDCKDEGKRMKEEDKYILPRIKKKRQKPRKMLSYVDELVEEQYGDNGETKYSPK
jgi:hypothetical protein